MSAANRTIKVYELGQTRYRDVHVLQQRLQAQRRESAGVHLGIEWPHVGRHLTEVLVKGFRILRELNSRKELRPDTQSERSEPALFIRRCIQQLACQGCVLHLQCRLRCVDARSVGEQP
jgi:hypothetical protein